MGTPCKELEHFMKIIQEKFDKWTPPRFIKDNLSKGERNFMNKIKENEETVYMVEDKGPSFTKMTKDQYIKSGEKELENEKFYKVTDDDKSENLKGMSDKLIEDMLQNFSKVVTRNCQNSTIF
jgi:hypothetical protein